MSEQVQQYKVTTAAGHCGNPGVGPFMIILLRIADEVIAEAKFQTYGCPAAQACADWVCDAVPGKTLESPAALSEEDVVRGADRMPLGRAHCPGLGVKVLRDAIANAHADAGQAVAAGDLQMESR